MTFSVTCLLWFGCAKEPFGPMVGEPEKPNYERELGPGELALRKITDPNKIPDFSYGFGRRSELAEAVRNSLNYMSKPSSKRYFPYAEISHDQVVASLQDFLRMIESPMTSDQINQEIRARYDVYESIGWDDQGTVLFTGYYRPIFEARYMPDETFRYPLHTQPPDLVKDSEGRTLGRRLDDGTIVEYFSRDDINQGRLPEDLALCYLSNPFEAYICTVQGSARLRMGDGSFFEVGYAANNGHEYTSIGREMIKDGRIPKEKLSLDGLRDHFAANPADLDHYLKLNSRYVFFTPRSGGPFGSLNEPVIPYCSIATDKGVFPRAAVSYVVTQMPMRNGGEIQQRPYKGFALDQDTGGAIRAAGRCDIYMGTGDEVGELAGRTFSEGQLYYIFLRPGGERDVASLGNEAPLE
jgi:membrane-bound lytic murein transglycosylase A